MRRKEYFVIVRKRITHGKWYRLWSIANPLLVRMDILVALLKSAYSVLTRVRPCTFEDKWIAAKPDINPNPLLSIQPYQLGIIYKQNAIYASFP